LEKHLGLIPGSTLKASGKSIVFDPPSEETSDYSKFSEKYSSVFLAMKYAIAKGDFENFGFIGNEKLATPEGE
jgi:hypothetical protein